MPNLSEFSLADGTSIRLELAPTGSAPLPPAQPAPDDLPDGMGPTVPVARGGGAAAGASAVAAMRSTLRPLGPLLQEIHDAVIASERPPHEMSVQFGVQVGQDLKLGIVGANGHASLTITATWQPQRAE
ncbi:hypothetical protein DY245_01330 [Streptomyces inhibens]|uniref:Trypsin-co-occurring domain-containing protein n=1 Tax=Streptomyces inhibens TaxID=2293571 RepID=A0A371QBG5_STRIH|nr:CU044_2847 family protein [Streptomyces inhibens]REK92032.1 hypothetical protein DY245_01330 [Streptomyces inhibens]